MACYSFEEFTLTLAPMLHYLVACIIRCGTQEFDFADKEVTMNRYDARRLESTRTFLNQQLTDTLRGVRGDGTG
jgi:hypothetical protein